MKELIETNGNIRKKNQSAIYAACLYVAGRQHDEMKTMEEVAEKTSVDKKDIFRALKFITKIVPKTACPTLFLASSQSQPQEEPADHVNANDKGGKCTESRDNVEVMVNQHLRAHIIRLCKVLNFDSEQKKCAEDMATAVAKNNFGLCSMPATQAAAIVWICSLFTRNQEVDIKVIVKHSTGKISIRKTYQQLVPHLQKFLPKHIIGKSEDWKEKLRMP